MSHSHKHESSKDQTIVSQAATIKETRVHDTAVKEVVKRIETEEVQPVIHRDIYTTEIHQTHQPVYQKEVLPTKVEERILPSQNLKEVHNDKGASNVRFTMENEKSSKFVEQATHSKIVKPAIVQETIHPQIITEVQPVIYREVIQPTLIKEVQNINEKIVEPPVIIAENDTFPAPSSTTTVYPNQPLHQHTSFKDKLKSLFHASSGVDTVRPLYNTTPLDDSGSVLRSDLESSAPVVIATPLTSSSTSLAKPL